MALQSYLGGTNHVEKGNFINKYKKMEYPELNERSQHKTKQQTKKQTQKQTPPQKNPHNSADARDWSAVAR